MLYWQKSEMNTVYVHMYVRTYVCTVVKWKYVCSSVGNIVNVRTYVGSVLVYIDSYVDYTHIRTYVCTYVFTYTINLDY